MASFVLRCDDCIKYHIIRCCEEGVTSEELEESLAVGLVVGGYITIPHLRRALQAWDELQGVTEPPRAGDTRDKDNTRDKDKVERFHLLLNRVREIVDGPSDRNEKLKTICQSLRDGVAYYDWVGFYIVDASKRDLVLGPFAGEPTEHVRIPFGKGICGQAAERKETFIVQDVSKETNYLSCSPRVQSEIVVPIFKNGEILGELDIDSHTLSPFTPEDREFLEDVCQMVSELF